MVGCQVDRSFFLFIFSKDTHTEIIKPKNKNNMKLTTPSEKFYNMKLYIITQYFEETHRTNYFM